MAFTQSPTAQTYSSPKIPAAYDIELRQHSLFLTDDVMSQDSGMVNLLPLRIRTGAMRNQDDIKVEAITRPAVTGYVMPSSSGFTCRGMYVWEYTPGSVLYIVMGSRKMYQSTNGTSWTDTGLLWTGSNGVVRFCEFIDSTGTKKLIMVDGTEGFVMDTAGTATKITDADFPSPHVPFPVFVNGRIYVAKKNTGDIYNSALDDPMTWTAGDFISSELYPDDVQALVKVNNYILAIGQSGSEYFYDAANPSGSPLARYEGGSLAFGTRFPNSIAYNKRQVVMLANNNDGESVIKAIEDFKVTDIDSGFLTGILDSRLQDNVTFNTMRAGFMRVSGELFYVLAIGGTVSTGADNPNKTLALNLDLKMWTVLEATDANGDLTPLPIWYFSPATSVRSVNYVAGGREGSDLPYFGILAVDGTAANDVYNGDGALIATVTRDIYTEIRTPNLDFDTKNLKTMSRMAIEATTGSSSATAVNLSVSWSDDDYKTWSTARDLDISGTTNFPFITQLGAFRQRAFKITYSGDEFIRYNSITFDINKGQQ